MTKPNEDVTVASCLPDDMVAGGIADDFDGTIVGVDYVLYDFNGKFDKPELCGRLTVRRDGPEMEGAEEEDRMVVEHQLAAGSEYFVPSEDGVTQSEKGGFALRVGQATSLRNNTSWAQYLRSMIEAEAKFRTIWKPDIRFMLGTRAHFNRLPEEKKPGEVKKVEAGKKKRDVLCVTKVHQLPGTSAVVPNASGPKPSAAPSKPAAASSTAPSGGGSIDEKLLALLDRVVAPGASMMKSALAGLVVKEAKGDKDVQKMVKRVGEVDFLSSDAVAGLLILFDKDAGKVERLATE